MADFLTGAALAVLAVTAAGLVAMWRSRALAEQMMSVQLLGSGGVAVLVLLAVATAEPAILDVAVLLALLAAFACAAFRSALVRPGRSAGEREPGKRER